MAITVLLPVPLLFTSTEVRTISLLSCIKVHFPMSDQFSLNLIFIYISVLNDSDIFHDRLFHTDGHVFFEFLDILAVLYSMTVIFYLNVHLTLIVMFSLNFLIYVNFPLNNSHIFHYSPFTLILMFSLNFLIYFQFCTQ